MKIICAKCNGPVGFWSSANVIHRDAVVIRARCHGELDKIEIANVAFMNEKPEAITMFETEKEPAAND